MPVRWPREGDAPPCSTCGKPRTSRGDDGEVYCHDCWQVDQVVALVESGRSVASAVLEVTADDW